jgi:hypothetical protein
MVTKIMSECAVDTFNKKVLSSYYNIFDKNTKYFNIYGYYLEKGENYIFLGTSETFHSDEGKMNMNTIGKLYNYSDNKEYYDASSNYTYNINSDSKILRTVSNKYYNLDVDNMISSDVNNNMIEIINEDDTKRIQLIKSEFGFNIFYISNGNLYAYEEYYKKEQLESMKINQKNLSIIELIIQNLVNKYNITNIININNNKYDSDDSSLSDTDREMMELGIYNMNLEDNELESSDEENNSDESSNEDDTFNENNTFIEVDHLEVCSSCNSDESDINSDTDIDTDLEEILKE